MPVRVASNAMSTLTRNPDGSITLHTTVAVHLPAGTSMLDAENALQAEVNKAGADLTGQMLQLRDAEGKPLRLRGRTFTAKKKKEPLHIETPYGCVVISRWAYQTSSGGSCFYPLDQAARLMGSATPKFAQMVSRKYVELPAAEVVRDLRENHGRSISADFVQRLADLTGEMAQAALAAPGSGARTGLPAPDAAALPPPSAVATVTVGMDGASMLMGMRNPQSISADGRKDRVREWRMAMIGTIALHDAEGRRLATLYAASAPPEHKDEGKSAFWEAMERELAAVKERYPQAHYVGISDGAADFVPWLQAHTSEQVLDFYHAGGYLYAASGAFPSLVPEGASADWWGQAACHELRHTPGAAAQILTEMEQRAAAPQKTDSVLTKALDAAITYFRNNLSRMHYADCTARGLPIGSGVTEAGCKLLIKKRLCGPGMTWGFKAASHLLSLRAVAHSSGGRWNSLWKSILA